MDKGEYNLQENEVEIDLLEMLKNVISHYKSCILLLVIGLAIGALLGLWKDSRHFLPKTEEEILQASNMANMYRTYKQRIEERNSGYLTTLSEDKQYYQATVRYYISSQNETDTVLLGGLLDITSTADYLYDIQEALAIDKNVYISSLSALLSTDFNMVHANSSVTVSLNEATDREVGYGVLTYFYAYLEEEQINTLMDYVDKRINREVSQLRGQYTFELEKLNVSTLPYTSNVVLSAQASITEANLRDYQQFNDYLEELAKTQRDNANYKKIVEWFRVQYMEEKPASHIVKYSVFGGAGLLGIWVCCLMVIYLFSGTIHTQDDLTSRYGLRVMGVLRGYKKGKGSKLTYKLDECKNSYTSLEYLTTAISSFGQEQAAIGIVGDSALAKQVAAKLADTATMSITAGNLMTDASLLKQACQNGGLILLASLGKTKHSEMLSTIQICATYNLHVLGTIVINEK